ncbi:UNVERIFIED_CONTAM: protein EFFECTOR OF TRANSCRIPTION 2 [Sesamum angustifolium]|uniref:Protein EFFECTOR OF TRANSCRIPTION 2 n=1 Tax=Sesamum angustifolium TaxID=2727405 RepID=A0AAW2N772_9LAMI
MSAQVRLTTATRLKREDFRRTKHDSAFSQWKVQKHKQIMGVVNGKLDGCFRWSRSKISNWTRLQQYGRDGAHLENGCLNDKLRNFQGVSSNKEPGLFIDVFSRGLPIVYRCAPMKSKNDAVITEKQLLDKFDYAWNKGSNGARRHDDICRKLDSLAKHHSFLI